MKLYLFLFLTFVLLHAVVASKYHDDHYDDGDCYSKCTKKKWKLKKRCSKRYCKIKRCNNKKKYGKKKYFRCVPKKKDPVYPPEPEYPYCENKCYLKWKKAKKGCSYKYCRVTACKRYYAGQYYAAYKCAYKTAHTPLPTPPIYPTCANKCHLKWNDAKYGCSATYCHVTTCKVYYAGRYHTAYKCAHKTAHTPHPTPPIYPTCANQCYRKWRDAKYGCSAKHCNVSYCKYYSRGQYYAGFKCASKVLPTVIPLPTPSSSPTPKPLTPYCHNKCYVKWTDANYACVRTFCKIDHCTISNGGKNYPGFKCANKAFPTVPPAPPAPKPYCDDYCYPKWKHWKVKKNCNPYHCKVAGCYYSKYTKKYGTPKTKVGYNCVHK